MRTPEIISLPISNAGYDMDNEQITRRTIEQMFASIRNDIIEIRDKTDKPASLSARRHQFLLMGMQNNG